MPIHAPASGESLWTDDPVRFEQRMHGINDPLLREAAVNFRDKGYVHLKGLVDHGKIAAATAAYNEWSGEHAEKMQSIRPDGRNPRVVNLHGHVWMRRWGGRHRRGLRGHQLRLAGGRVRHLPGQLPRDGSLLPGGHRVRRRV